VARLCNREMSSTDTLRGASKFADANKKPSVLVPIVRATAESLSGYGHIVPDFDAEDIIRVTWPKLSGTRPIVSGTGHLQVLKSIYSLTDHVITVWTRSCPIANKPRDDFYVSRNLVNC